MKKIYLLTGEIESGKTSSVQKWIDQNIPYFSFAGILAPVINNERYFKDLSSGKIFSMHTTDEMDKVNIGRFTFSQNAFNEAKKVLKSARADWIIIDEFGPLELRNQGLNPVITELLASPLESNLLIILREKLLKDFLDQYSLRESDFELFRFQRLDTSAAILAGGKSSRMGFDKALADFGGVPLINILIKELKKTFIDIKIIANEKEKFSNSGISVSSDKIIGFGPLSGIHSALTGSGTEKNLILSCDMPFLSSSLFAFLSDAAFSSTVLMMKYEGHIQPFPGIYSKKIIPLLENYMADRKAGNKQIHDIISEFDNADLIDFSKTGFSPQLFYNMNTYDDYLKAVGIYKSRLNKTSN